MSGGDGIMAVAVLYMFDESMTSERYDRIMREAFQDKIAPGVISHTAGPLDNGWYAFDVYESDEVAQRMKQGVTSGVGAMGANAPQLMTYKVARTLTADH